MMVSSFHDNLKVVFKSKSCGRKTRRRRGKSLKVLFLQTNFSSLPEESSLCFCLFLHPIILDVCCLDYYQLEEQVKEGKVGTNKILAKEGGSFELLASPSRNFKIKSFLLFLLL